MVEYEPNTMINMYENTTVKPIFVQNHKRTISLLQNQLTQCPFSYSVLKAFWNTVWVCTFFSLCWQKSHFSWYHLLWSFETSWLEDATLSIISQCFIWDCIYIKPLQQGCCIVTLGISHCGISKAENARSSCPGWSSLQSLS